MKVAFIGNKDNNAYRLAGWLRGAGVDAHVFHLKSERDVRCGPELIDRHLADGTSRRPEWLHELDDTWPRTWMPLRHPAAAPIEREFDAVVTSGVTGLMAGRHFRRLPLVHLSLGSEVTVLPLLIWQRGATLRQRYASLLARRALARADAVITSYSATVGTLARLGHRAKTRLWGFPEDVQGNPRRVDPRLLEELNARYAPYEAVFLWLSRLNFLDPDAHDYKAPERFLDALERIVKVEGRNVRAVIGRHGNHVEAFCRLVEQKGLAGHVDYVPHLPYWQLLTYLSIRHAVVFDLIDVRQGTLGGLTREALSVGALVVMAIDRESMDAFYGPDCPLLDAPDAERCYEAMRDVLAMTPAERQAHLARCGEWSARCVDQSVAVRYLIRVLGEVVYGARIGSKLAAWEALHSGRPSREPGGATVDSRRAAPPAAAERQAA